MASVEQGFTEIEGYKGFTEIKGYKGLSFGSYPLIPDFAATKGRVSKNPCSTRWMRTKTVVR